LSKTSVRRFPAGRAKLYCNPRTKLYQPTRFIFQLAEIIQHFFFSPLSWSHIYMDAAGLPGAKLFKIINRLPYHDPLYPPRSAIHAGFRLFTILNPGPPEMMQFCWKPTAGGRSARFIFINRWVCGYIVAAASFLVSFTWDVVCA
jgi:hypothetical protein